MKPRLVIFGAGDIAQLAHFYFTHDSDYDVAAFTVDAAYRTQDEFCGLPLVAFEDVEKTYPAGEFDLFVAVSYAKLNAARAGKCAQALAKGYRLASYVSSKATTWPGLAVGHNCFILEDNTLQPFTRIGHNVTLWSGNHIGHHAEIADNCFITSHVVISGGVKVGENCFIGVNATIRDHVTIGARCVVGAGAVILADAEPEGVYMGNATERAKVPSTRLRKL
jgi:sugar O-acyltransferase (sialic acid O-acetyltransferase NeuD family)